MKRPFLYTIIFAIIVILQSCKKEDEDGTRLPIIGIITTTYQASNIFEDRIINTEKELNNLTNNYNITFQDKDYKILTKDFKEWSIISIHYYTEIKVDYVSYEPQRGITVQIKKQNTIQTAIPMCLFIKVAKKIPYETNITIN